MSFRIIKKALKQTCVYWPPVGSGDDSQQTFGDPVEMKCRWTDHVEMIPDRSGQTWLSKAKVMTEIDVLVGGILWLGRLVELTDIQDPFANGTSVTAPAWQIMRFDKIPTLDAKKFLRLAYL